MPAVMQPPADLLSNFTMHGAIALEHFYVDEMGDAEGTHYTYPKADIEQMVAGAHRMLQKPQAVSKPTHRWLTEVIAREAPGASVVVFGSIEPWVETLALAAGATNVMTVDYNRLTFEHPKMSTTTVSAFHESALRRFDLAIAHGAFDHDGLGRYGDRIHPNGDLIAMRTVWRSLRPGGRLLLSVPVGPDLLVWNLHRRYGNIRLPRLLAGWEVVEKVGWSELKLHAPADHRRRYEPIFVLERGDSVQGP